MSCCDAWTALARELLPIIRGAGVWIDVWFSNTAFNSVTHSKKSGL